MANQIQRLPVIEWQPKPTPVARTYTSTPVSNTFPTGIILVLAIALTSVAGIIAASTIETHTQEVRSTYIHRSN
jgi:hypothetical protein